eukprot:2757365-Amphidinium_carterae.1
MEEGDARREKKLLRCLLASIVNLCRVSSLRTSPSPCCSSAFGSTSASCGGVFLSRSSLWERVVSN